MARRGARRGTKGGQPTNSQVTEEVSTKILSNTEVYFYEASV